jgi:hypothetical protein
MTILVAFRYEVNPGQKLPFDSTIHSGTVYTFAALLFALWSCSKRKFQSQSDQMLNQFSPVHMGTRSYNFQQNAKIDGFWKTVDQPET